MELIHQRSLLPEDRDFITFEGLIDDVLGSRAALESLALAAAGADELAGGASEEDPIELLRRGAVTVGWLDG